MPSVTVIDSDSLLEDVEHHFRVCAGPGAGKSHWLATHIQNVIHKSKRLTPPARIACISYTNVAADEIRSRLSQLSDRVEVSTIHSFLYRHLVKPYLYVIKDSREQPVVAYQYVNRHEEHRPSYKRVSDWVKGLREFWLLQDRFKDQLAVLYDKLRQLIWEQDANGKWAIRPRTLDYMGPKLKTICSTDNLTTYKSLYWQAGIIDHEDVLYFAQRLLDEHSQLPYFLSARFRYLFIDEFQDTHPVQTRMVEKLADCGTVVGVIGDEQQSIYGFLGTKPEHFRDFALTGCKDYRIEKNRRSTAKILSLLNRVRIDGLVQAPHRDVDGEAVRVYSGDVTLALKSIEGCLPKGVLLEVLTRKNKEASKIRNPTDLDGRKLWETLYATDIERFGFLEGVLAAGESGSLGHFGMAISGLVRTITKRGGLREPLRSKVQLTELQCRGVAVALLEFMLSNYGKLQSGSVLDAYRQFAEYLLKAHNVDLKAVIKGKGFHTFADTSPYSALASTVRQNEETRSVRTIHQAKGAQWPSVAVWFAEASRIKHIVAPDPNLSPAELEEQRITYVSLSRASDQLFVVVPDLSSEDETILEEMGTEVNRCVVPAAMTK